MAKAQQQQIQVQFTQVLNELANRLRILEAKQSNFAEKLLIINQNVIDQFKKSQADVKKIHEKISDVEKEMGKVKNVVRHITEEAAKFARDDDVKRIQKYIDFWNPLHFVTEGEVQNMIDKAHKRKTKKKEPLLPKLEKRRVEPEIAAVPRALADIPGMPKLDDVLTDFKHPGDKNAK